MNTIKSYDDLINIVKTQFTAELRDQLNAWNIPSNSDLLTLITVYSIVTAKTDQLRFNMTSVYLTEKIHQLLKQALHLHRWAEYQVTLDKMLTACEYRSDEDKQLVNKAHTLISQVQSIVNQCTIADYLNLLELAAKGNDDLSLAIITDWLNKATKNVN